MVAFAQGLDCPESEVKPAQEIVFRGTGRTLGALLEVFHRLLTVAEGQTVLRPHLIKLDRVVQSQPQLPLSLAFLALVMQLLAVLFPERKSALDPTVVAAISSTVASLYPGARVSRIEEES